MKSKLKNVLISFMLIGTLVNVEAAENKYPEEKKLTSRILDNNVNKPEENKPSIDHHYNTIIKKVIKKEHKLSNYPKVQSWNKDMTLIRIHNRLYDADTLEESILTSKYFSNSSSYKGLCSRNSDYFRWSNLQSDIFYVLDSSNRFVRGSIVDNNIDCSNVIESFSDYEDVHLGPDEGNIDFNDKYVVFIAKKYNSTSVYLILFDIEEEKRVWEKELVNNKWINREGVWGLSSIDWVSVSPSGKYILINERHPNSKKGGMYRYDINFKNKVVFQYLNQSKNELLTRGGHGDIGYDTDGNEVLVQFISGRGIYQFSLENPKEEGKKILLNPYGGVHISCRNSERKGWCYVTTHLENYSSVFALKIDGSDNEMVQNFTQSHMSLDNGKIFGSPSPDGTKVIFNSDWGSNNKVSEFDTFIVTTY